MARLRQRLISRGLFPSWVRRAAYALVVAPVANPGIVSIPLAFLLGIVGTYVGRNKKEDPAKQAEMEVRSLTGIGVEKAINH